jgi:hypothetical protein
MNSLFEIVLWGAPAVLLSWGLLLVLACAAVYRDLLPHEKTPPLRSWGVNRLDTE